MENIIYIKECTSTNNILKEMILKNSEIANATTIYTDYQTSGRGQRGNSWESEKDKNLIFSTLIKPNKLLAKEQFVISELFSLSVKDFLSQYVENILIKWPNDIYYKDKKICGILIENNLSSQYIKESIAGIGININQDKFYSNAPNPISLKNITGTNYNIDILIKEYLCILKKWINFFNNQEYEKIHNEYLNSIYRRNKKSQFIDNNGIFYGKIITVEPYGKLVIEHENNIIKKYEFKEVSYII